MKIIYSRDVNGIKRVFLDSKRNTTDDELNSLYESLNGKYFEDQTKFLKDNDFLDLLRGDDGFGNLYLKRDNKIFEIMVDNEKLRTEKKFIELIYNLIKLNELSCEIKVVDVEEGFDFDIYFADDGSESIHEKHRCFY